MARQKQITRWRNKQKRKDEITKYIKPNKIVTVFDVETTGLDEKAKIIQFSAIKYKITDDYKLKKVNDFDIYINPKEKLSKKIVEITGITDKILEAAKDETYWVDEIFSYIEDSDVLAGYNIPFDLRMLNQMAKRNQMCFDEVPYVDVMEMARDWVSKSESEKHNLQTIVEYFHPTNHYKFHSAIDDVMATATLLQDFIILYMEYEDEFKNKDFTHLESAHLFINPRKKSEQRIRLQLSSGEYGDIFWDIKDQEWGCCQKTSAKQYFNSINLTNLEEQFMEKYGYKFGCNIPKDVAKKWMDFKKSKDKE